MTRGDGNAGLIVVLLAAIGAALFFARNKLFKIGYMGRIPFEPIFDQVARARGVSKALLLAITFVESHFDPRAFNEEEAADRRRGRDVDAIGLMQILYPDTALGFRPGISMESLYDPETNIDLGALVIRDNIKRWPTTDEAGFPFLAVSAYQAGSPKYVAGSLSNQLYVDQVREAWLGYR